MGVASIALCIYAEHGSRKRLMNDENGWAFAYSLLKLNFCNVLHKICNIRAIPTYSLRVYTDSMIAMSLSWESSISLTIISH